MQGLELPQPTMTAAFSLPAAVPLLAAPPRFLAAEHAYSLPVDTAGQAVRRRRRGQQQTTAPAPPPTDPDAMTVGQEVQEEEEHVPGPSAPSVPVPRTTEWRHRKREAQGLSPSPAKRPRKQYTCRKCGGTGHTQYYGQRYCPQSGMSFDEWKAGVVAARQAKKTATDAAAEGRAQ